MFWNTQDFAREVCRQLVELASIRKRLEGDPELLEKIRSLEASHEGLLRKLAEGEANPAAVEPPAPRAARPRRSQRSRKPQGPKRESARKAGAAGDPAPPTPAPRRAKGLRDRRSGPGETPQDGVQASAVRSTRRFLRSICAELRNLQPTRDAVPGTITDDPASSVSRDDARGAAALPRLDETCGACGKVLLSSVLGGEPVRCIAGRWYHRRCLPGREGLGRPELRN